MICLKEITHFTTVSHNIPAMNQTVTLVSHDTPRRHCTRSTVSRDTPAINHTVILVRTVLELLEDGTHLLQFYMVCLQYITQMHKFSMA